MSEDVSQEDRALLDIITGNTMKFRPRAETARLEAIARYRIAAEQRGIKEGLERAAVIAEKERRND